MTTTRNKSTHSRPRLIKRGLEFLNTPLTTVGLLFAGLTVPFSCEERAREEPDIRLRVTQSEMRDDEAKELTLSLQEDLSSLEEEYANYSGLHLENAIDSLTSPGLQWGVPSDQDSGQRTWASILESARDGIKDRLAADQIQQEALISDLRSLERDANVQFFGIPAPVDAESVVDELRYLENVYFFYTGSVLQDLVIGIESGEKEREEIGPGLREARGQLEQGFELRAERVIELVGRIEGLTSEYSEKKPPRRLHLKLLVENHSQQATVVRRALLAQFRDAQNEARRVDLEATEDRAIPGYSIAEMDFVSRSVWVLDENDRAALLGGSDERTGPVCEAVTVMDLFGEVWTGECSDAQGSGVKDELEKELLLGARRGDGAEVLPKVVDWRFDQAAFLT